ncbi:MAG: hypothetical protein A2Y07_05020 [Planctomycetes bacterium GWF2_50_10]|nr:MAG: hypothetical protein A2Y07_05020 [Planctomycetes bacterium GWF2_50_10]
MEPQYSTGFEKLDDVLNGIIAGDNIVWQVDSIEDYIPFANAFCKFSASHKLPLVYFRFAKHPHLVDESSGAEIHVLDPLKGFETFITQIHAVIASRGPGGCYLFDCLSDLAADWYSDRMLGNFFMLTCPYLYQMETIAYFAVLRNKHSFHATSAIMETTQLFLDIYSQNSRTYVHPIKVQGRYSPTMNMLHVRDNGNFTPVAQSLTITEVLAHRPWSRLDSASQMLGYWNRTFSQAEQVLLRIEQGRQSETDVHHLVHKLLRMIISRDEPILSLAAKYLSLKDVLTVWRRMIGTGLVGGKTVGMLLARAILEKYDARWKDVLEPHDSFYIGSDVFYTFLVQNKIWWMRQKQRDPAHFLEQANEARQLMMYGSFPEYIMKQFGDLLDYFGQSPIIIRSSSLLEDNYGNAFAGKYESIFCANQGPRAKRIDDFVTAVRRIYASSMSEKALTYRAHKGLLQKDEQMALLVQRVSGAPYGNFFFPQAAGVGFSFNPYAWNEAIDPEAGMLRLVFGLGTRAVDRSDDDYTRIVALNEPQLKPEMNLLAAREFAQRRVDVLDLELNRLVSKPFEEVTRSSANLPLDMFATYDREMEIRAKNAGVKQFFAWTLTFDKLLTQTRFTDDMREMLATLEKAYRCPVDTEFTANFFNSSQYRVNLLQCRPLQLKGQGNMRDANFEVTSRDIVLESDGPVIGQNRLIDIDRVIYVVPAIYSQMVDTERYSIARLIGQILHSGSGGYAADFAGEQPISTMLIGPGRWGTSTPSLGIPVTFAEINRASVICEIAAMRADFVPDVSLGTHFFSDLIEMEMLYLGLYPSRESTNLKNDFFEKQPNLLTQIIPSAARWESCVHVIDPVKSGKKLKLYADTVKQKVVCFL